MNSVRFQCSLFGCEIGETISLFVLRGRLACGVAVRFVQSKIKHDFVDFLDVLTKVFLLSQKNKFFFWVEGEGEGEFFDLCVLQFQSTAQAETPRGHLL